jgi:predicted TIM-barrel fold metal-dependent hydrolase
MIIDISCYPTDLKVLPRNKIVFGTDSPPNEPGERRPQPFDSDVSAPESATRPASRSL